MNSSIVYEVRNCQRHGLTTFIRHRCGKNKGKQRHKYRCTVCEEERKVEKANLAKEIRRILVHMCGNMCARCEYQRYIGCLQFHHIDPSTKNFELSAGFDLVKQSELLIEEANKCVLLCSVCHTEIEAKWPWDMSIIPDNAGALVKVA